jgi:hypothetical protein
LEERRLLAIDWGDAPDLGIGTGVGDYNTSTADGGPSHTIVANLFMGGGVDGEADGLPSPLADGDDIDQALPDDEDGLANPTVDLALTEQTAPRVNVTVTNNTGSGALLYGWIDYSGLVWVIWTGTA